ncbi:MAG: formylglycine-generating enzyme family protein [Candidatus Hydrogenedentota bacterium]
MRVHHISKCVSTLLVVAVLIALAGCSQPGSEPDLSISPASITPNVEDSENGEGDGKREGEDETKIFVLPGDVPLEMVRIPAGTFMMGSPSNEEGRFDSETQHRVTLTKGSWLGKYEVTQRQWEAVMGNNPSKFKGDDFPVEQVSWNDCQEFIRKLNSQGEGLFNLPTEAEWEYACRAGSTSAYSFAREATNLGNYAWFSENSEQSTHPVGLKKPNSWGLYDVHGNVWEWCADWYGDYPSGAVTDPKGASSGSVRVLRGGSWFFIASTCRSAKRYYFYPTNSNLNYGFRVTRSVSAR